MDLFSIALLDSIHEGQSINVLGEGLEDQPGALQEVNSSAKGFALLQQLACRQRAARCKSASTLLQLARIVGYWCSTSAEQQHDMSLQCLLKANW